MYVNRVNRRPDVDSLNPSCAFRRLKAVVTIPLAQPTLMQVLRCTSLTCTTFSDYLRCRFNSRGRLRPIGLAIEWRFTCAPLWAWLHICNILKQNAQAEASPCRDPLSAGSAACRLSTSSAVTRRFCAGAGKLPLLPEAIGNRCGEWEKRAGDTAQGRVRAVSWLRRLS